MEHESLLKVEQVAEMLGMSAPTIRRWVMTRFIPYQKIGRAVRFSVTEIRDWMKSKCVGPVEIRKLHNDTDGFTGEEK
jgi:excisionase family DNA binding protein